MTAVGVLLIATVLLAACLHDLLDFAMPAWLSNIFGTAFLAGVVSFTAGVVTFLWRVMP